MKMAFVRQKPDQVMHRPHHITDPVYGYITLESELTAIIMHPWYQRLQDIKQTGDLDRLFPNATQTRYLHGIQVAHQSGIWARHLYPTIDTPSLIRIKIAGLCHDLGHCVSSHNFDRFVAKSMLPPEMHDHEDRSAITTCRLLTELFPDMTSVHKKAVANMMLGIPPPAEAYMPPACEQIVKNARCEIDSDKFSYLQLDSYCIGIQNRLSIDRMIAHSKVLQDERGQWMIMFHVKMAPDVIDFFNTRWYMYSSVYQQPAVLGISLLSGDMLVEVCKKDNWFEKNKQDPDFWLKLTDSRFRCLAEDLCPDLFHRWQTRNWYTLTDAERDVQQKHQQQPTSESISSSSSSSSSSSHPVVDAKVSSCERTCTVTTGWCSRGHDVFKNVRFFTDDDRVVQVDIANVTFRAPRASSETIRFTFQLGDPQ